jgi:gas vesicle protein
MIQPDKKNLIGKAFPLRKQAQPPVVDVRGAEKALNDAAEELNTAGVHSLKKFADSVLEYARTMGTAYNHQKHEITRLKLGQDIREIEEERAKGSVFREMSLTIKFFRHIYDFALEGGLLPDKMKRYVNMFRNLVIFGTAAAILAVPATGVNLYLLRKIARENQSLLGLSDNVRNQQGMISKLEAGLNRQVAQISDIRTTQEVYGRNQKLTDEKIQANYDAIKTETTSLRLGAEERERQIAEQAKTLADLASTYEKGVAGV